MAQKVSGIDKHVSEELLDSYEHVPGIPILPIGRNKAIFEGTAEDTLKLFRGFRPKSCLRSASGILTPPVHRFQECLSRTIVALQRRAIDAREGPV
jgi:hypothetical protein